MHETRAGFAAWVAAVNAHDIDRIVATITEDLLWQLWDQSTRGSDASREAWRLLFDGIPDWHMEPLDTIVEGTRVAARWRMSGTHTGPLRFRGTASMDHPIPPSGKRFEVEGASIHEFRDGRMAVNRAYWRPDQMLSQLGIKLG